MYGDRKMAYVCTPRVYRETHHSMVSLALAQASVAYGESALGIDQIYLYQQFRLASSLEINIDTP